MSQIIDLGKLRLSFQGTWSNTTTYEFNDVVKYGGNLYVYVNPLNTSANVTTNTLYWSLLLEGVNIRGVWDSGTTYAIGEGVVYNQKIFISTANNNISNTPAQASAYWAMYAGDILPIQSTTNQGKSLTVPANNGAPIWLSPTASNNVRYVAPHGTNTAASGKSLGTPYLTIKYACADLAAIGQGGTIHVKNGEYYEQLPIVVPPGVAIIGDNQRTVTVYPTTGLSDDNVNLNVNSTMFQMSNGSILNKMTFRGMTGWEPGLTPADIGTSTVKGVVVAFNPDSPVTSRSPYVLECAAILTGGVGALIDGSKHTTGYKSMLFHEYTVISDNGVGYWVKDLGKSEIVSCFTYFCYFGYAATGGGFIRAISGNNSYGTWGAYSRGYDATETPVTGTLYGKQIDVVYAGNGSFNVGDTITASSGGTATVTNAQLSANKLYITNIVGDFNVAATITATSGGTATVGAAGISNQKGLVLVMNNLTARPIPGGSITITGDAYSYVIQSVSGSWVNASSVITVILTQEKLTGSAENTPFVVRYKYSQVRLTAHDFLNIGTGGMATTNYPNTPTIAPSQAQEVEEVIPGRVYYVSTDQDGNFRVGDYFKIDQATGRATLNANAFDLSGLTSLKLGSIGAQLGELISEFSSDTTLSGNSNAAVPTEYAVKQYFTKITDTVLPATTNTYDFGSSTKRWKDVHGTTIYEAGNRVATRGLAQTFTDKLTFQGNAAAIGAKLVNAVEAVTLTGTAATGTINFDVTTQSIIFSNVNATANFTLNVRGNATTTLNTLLGIGEVASVVFMNQNGGSAYWPSTFQIDGVTITPKWNGGTAPTGGNASALDIYMYTIIKTAASTYTVLASQAKHV
jgi:hypothetical protein